MQPEQDVSFRFPTLRSGAVVAAAVVVWSVCLCVCFGGEQGGGEQGGEDRNSSPRPPHSITSA